jgi:hypothetical protein
MAYIFGGSTGLTYDEMMRRRMMADALGASIGKPSTVGEGLSALGAGIAGGLLGRSANKAEKAGKEAAQQRAQSALGQLWGASMQPASYSPAPQGFTAQTPGQEVASDVMAALGKAPQGADFYRQGLIARGLPEHVAEGFVMNFQDESGLNPGINERNPIVPGSRGGFGLAQWTGPRRKALEAFAQSRGASVSDPNVQMDFLVTELQGAESAAAQQILAAGTPGEAGAAIVNSFLRPAEEHRASRAAKYMGGASPDMVMQSMGAGTDPAEVMAVLSDPYLDEGTRSMLGSLFQQQIQRRNQMTDPAYQMDMQAKQLELQRAQMEIDAMGQPQVPDELRERQALAQAAGIQPGTPEYQQFILNGETAGSDMPSQFQALDLQAQAAGLMPGTEEYKNFMLSNGSAGAPAAFVALDMQAQAAGFKPGTPEYQNFMATRGAGLIAESKAVGEAKGEAQINLPSATAQAQQSLDLIDSIRNDPALPSITGSIQGGLLPAGIPGLTGGQAGADLGVKIEQLQGTAFLQAFESLKGAGQITEIEGQKAEAAIARLKRAQSTEAYQAALDDLAGIIRSGLGRSQSKAGVAPQAAPQAPPSGGQRLKFNPQTGAFE